MTQHLATQNTVFVESAVKGKILVFQEGLSFWGGVDPDTGVIIDAHHPDHGASVSGKVVLMPTSRGSCSGSGRSECHRQNTCRRNLTLTASQQPFRWSSLAVRFDIHSFTLTRMVYWADFRNTEKPETGIWCFGRRGSSRNFFCKVF